MKVIKTTDKYTFYQDGNDYILALGEIKKGDDTTTGLLFEKVEDVKGATVRALCGCTIVEKNIISENSFSIQVKYTQCDPTYSKVVIINEGKPNGFKIRIKGSCKI